MIPAAATVATTTTTAETALITTIIIMTTNLILTRYGDLVTPSGKGNLGSPLTPPLWVRDVFEFEGVRGVCEASPLTPALNQ
jgi:hypothetical protein